eukprot:CFRG5650T1
MDPFGHPGQADLYSAYRPRYPQRFIDDIINCVSSKKNKVAEVDTSSYVDVCCGTGQITIPLSKHFSKTIGIDRSIAQLNAAKKEESIEFVCGDALHLPITTDHTADLLTIAQGLHWLPLDEFFKEVKRVLKPEDGLFVVLGYSICSVESSLKAKKLFEEYFHMLDNYWDCDRRLVDSAFEKVDFPFLNVRRVMHYEDVTMSLASFDKYLQSMSSYRTWKETTGRENDTPDILASFMTELNMTLGENNDGTVDVRIPFFMISMQT